ncbi:carboxylesterase/lipase family protein [Novosphingobium sp.]|uniref:carboxylesterase/lipase family protein n=1 Tax=Novosphingobium sp. TaxID=1874826 RepID=UPI003526865A
MSAAEGFGRRAVLAGGLAGALLTLSGRAGAESPLAVQCVGPVRAPDGHFQPDRCEPMGGRPVWSYPGIRYARADRFCAPQPVRSAQQVGRWFPVSPQPGDRYGEQSEDCLFLNVWKPGNAHPRRPVMVYFHGGAYSTGSVSDPLNDGAALAARGDVVVVTVNHRLNALGYLYLARLDPRFPDSGNAGQLDLICALEWIRRNIAAFGGDPDNVTVFGQSGGGAKIATLMAMPAAKGLFHKAITMSGQQVTASGPLNATRRAAAVLARLGGADPAAVPVGQLLAALSATDPVLGGGVYMGPVLDMRHLHRHPFWPDAAPQGNAIPLLLGNTVAETRAFYPADGRVLGGLDFGNLAARIAPEMRIDAHPEWVAAQFRARYPADTAEQLFHRIVTAARSWRGQVIEAELRARAGAAAHVYQLDFEDAAHTDDIALAFGTAPSPTPAQAAMSARVMDAFVRFARTGNPGWPAYDLKARKTMVFDRASRVVSDPRQWERELFAPVPYIQPGS